MPSKGDVSPGFGGETSPVWQNSTVTDEAAPAESQDLRADALRGAGIDHPALANDEELVGIVRLLFELGLTTEDLVDEDLTYLAGPIMIRPDATVPRQLLGEHRDPEFARRSALALGFGYDDETGLLTPAEIDAILFFESLRPLLGDDDLLALLRALGSAMSKLARSVVSSLRVNYEMPILEESGSLVEVARSYSTLVDEMLPKFLDATSAVLRRHLALITAQPTVWNVDSSGVATLETLTVGFIDLVGFTSFTEKAGPKQFVEALTAFEAQVNEVVVGTGGTLVKMLGDEAMFVAPTPSAGISIARRLLELRLVEEGPSSVRIGLAAGEVVASGGDFFGTPVNVAARVVAQATPDTIIVTKAVAASAHASTVFASLGAHELRGISDPVELFRLETH